MKQLTAAQRRFYENAPLISASRLVFSKLLECGVPLRTLKDVAETTSGGTPVRSVSEYYGGRIPWIKSGELNDGFIEMTDEFITDEGLRNSSAKIFPKGTLLVALYGATVGKTGILKIDAASNQAVCSVIPKTREITTRFLFWFFRYKRPEFLKNSFGGAQPNISQRILRETRLPIPEIELQLKICDFLEIVEKRQNGSKRIELPDLPPQLTEIRQTVARIEKLATRIKEAKSLKEITLLESFRFWKVLSRIARTSDYPVKRLEEMVEFLDGRRVPLNESERLSRKGSYPYYGASGIIDYIDDFIFDEELLLLSEDGANLIYRSTPIAFIAEGKYWVNNHAHVLRPNTKIADLKFLKYALSDYDVSAFNHASAQPKLNQKNARKIKFPLPPLDEQRRIVACLDSLQSKLDALRRHQAETAAELDALLPAVLERAFRGEL